MYRVKKYLGIFKRAIIGIFHDIFEKYAAIPKNCTIFTVGKSTENRPIQCIKIGNGLHKILYTAGIHGNEVGTIKLMHNFINWAYVNSLAFQETTLFIIPCLNPDGLELARKNPDYFGGGKIGRFNDRNVDLNRNFDTPGFQKKSKWSFGKNYSEASEVYCGEYGNSEPEIDAITKFIKKENIKIWFMFHNAGREAMGNLNQISQELTHLYAKKTKFRYVDNEEWGKMKQSGTAKEWCDINKIAYVEIEGSTRWGSDWNIQKKALEETLRTAISSHPE